MDQMAYQRGVHTLKLLVEDASDDALMMSRQHCHAHSVSSIVVRNAAGRLTRVFLAWPSHSLHWNFPGSLAYEVGIHDHKYPLSLQLIHGTVENHTYDLSGSDCATLLREFRFTQSREVGEPGVTEIGTAHLELDEITQLARHWEHWLDAYALHTIWCPEGAPAAWVVSEGDVIKGSTRLFTNKPPVFNGLYMKFDSPKHVRDHVEKFIEVCQ